MPQAIAFDRAAESGDDHGWIPVEDGLPSCSRKPDSFGVEVLIYPRSEHGDSTAFYGRRVTSTPSFYKGGAVVQGVQFWQYLPKKPVDVDDLLPGMATRQPREVTGARDGLPGKLGTQKALTGLPGKLGRMRGEAAK